MRTVLVYGVSKLTLSARNACGLVVEVKRQANKTQLFHFTDTDFLSFIVVTFWQQLLLWDPLVLLSLLALISVVFTSSECSSLTLSFDVLTYFISWNFRYIPVRELLSLIEYKYTNSIVFSVLVTVLNQRSSKRDSLALEFNSLLKIEHIFVSSNRYKQAYFKLVNKIMSPSNFKYPTPIIQIRSHHFKPQDYIQAYDLIIVK